jgi:hypothetical protein
VDEARAGARAECDDVRPRHRALQEAPLAGRDDPVGGGVAREDGRADGGGVVRGRGIAQVAEGASALPRTQSACGVPPSRGRSAGPAASITQLSGRRTASIRARCPPADSPYAQIGRSG